MTLNTLVQVAAIAASTLLSREKVLRLSHVEPDHG